MSGGAVDAGVMNAGEHEHSLVELPALNTGLLLLLGVIKHIQNTNLLLRQFLPKGNDFEYLNQKELQKYVSSSL